MKFLNAWLLTSLITFTVAVIGYLSSESGFAWSAFAYPVPILKDNFDDIYLSDFAYISFLSLSVYWLIQGLLGKVSPALWNMSGIMLLSAGALFAIVAIDFIAEFLPKTQNCTGNTLANGITIEVCEFSNSYRAWVGLLAAFSLIASLLFSLVGVSRSDPEPEGESE